MYFIEMDIYKNPKLHDLFKNRRVLFEVPELQFDMKTFCLYVMHTWKNLHDFAGNGKRSIMF